MTPLERMLALLAHREDLLLFFFLHLNRSAFFFATQPTRGRSGSTVSATTRKLLDTRGRLWVQSLPRCSLYV